MKGPQQYKRNIVRIISMIDEITKSQSTPEDTHTRTYMYSMKYSPGGRRGSYLYVVFRLIA